MKLDIKTQGTVLGFSIMAAPFETQIDCMVQWAQQRLSRVVCVANVHMLMEAHWNPDFAQVLQQADCLTPDGMPLVWMLNLLNGQRHDRVAGIEILKAVCDRAQHSQVAVFFVGANAETMAAARQRLHRDLPTLKIAGMQPLPFRPLTPEEDRQLVEQINASGAGIVFVALGCPKQETWMSYHRGQINAVMVGIGGAFPIYAGLVKHAPKWVRGLGLEWAYRLKQEPGRLWKRYVSTIPPFIFLSLRQVLAVKLFDRDPDRDPIRNGGGY
ncbi:glycosyltransferase [filamentous cyanobacterium CCP5]|nr:glycosyltransferase [filamentous cyanobacterium CCP5]